MCEECNERYALKTNKSGCVTCDSFLGITDSNCLRCEATDTIECVSCDIGYAVDTGICVEANIEGCAMYDYTSEGLGFDTPDAESTRYSDFIPETPSSVQCCMCEQGMYLWPDLNICEATCDSNLG